VKNILVCTIIRNQINNLDRWWHQLHELVAHCPEYNFTFSIFENDSTDGTKEWLVKNLSNQENVVFSSVDIGTRQYGSVWSVDRIKNLAHYRQKCLNQVNINIFNKVAYIEPDIEYDAKWCSELINARHPAQLGIVPDIYSAWALRSLNNPKESTFLYDTCATRQTKDDLVWNFESESKWRRETVQPTDLGGADSNCLHTLYSTFNCFCVYNSEAFKTKSSQSEVKWGYTNKGLNTNQTSFRDHDNNISWLDADTAVICEDFREKGYNKIYINTNCLVRHR